MIICSFSSPSLDELTGKQARDDQTVLRALKASGRFSTWEVDDTRKIWRTIGRLTASGFITVKHTRTAPPHANEPAREVDAFPWSFVTVTALGEQFLSMGKQP